MYIQSDSLKSVLESEPKIRMLFLVGQIEFLVLRECSTYWPPFFGGGKNSKFYYKKF